MKKIISLISIAVISITVFCIPSFAYSRSFTDYFTLDYMSVDALSSTDDYAYYIGSNGLSISAYSRGDTPFNACRFVHVYFKYSGEQIKAGDRFIATLHFVLQDNSLTRNTQSPQASASIQAKINGSSFQSVGSVVFRGYGFDEAEGGLYDLFANIDFYAEEDIDSLYFSFGINFNGFEPLASEFISITFDEVEDFYFGSADSPNAPKYDSNTETIGKTDDLKNQEEQIMQDTEQGREETLSLFQNFGKYLDEFAVPLLAIKGLFDYLVGDTLFEGILLISLTLGLLSFVFNIFPSIQARQNRERQAEAQRTKNAQYNAMMNKLNNQNKGGG